MYANKLVTTRHAIESKKTSRSQVMEPGRVSSAYVVYLFFSFLPSKASTAMCLLAHAIMATVEDPRA
eukprot:1140750-Pelagomonas_calceolata.AAC.1